MGFGGPAIQFMSEDRFAWPRGIPVEPEEWKITMGLFSQSSKVPSKMYSSTSLSSMLSNAGIVLYEIFSRFIFLSLPMIGASSST